MSELALKRIVRVHADGTTETEEMRSVIAPGSIVEPEQARWWKIASWTPASRENDDQAAYVYVEQPWDER